MSKVAYENLADAWSALLHQRQAGKAEPPRDKWPTALPVHRIKQWPEVFQHRKPGKHATEAHTRELAKGAALGDLDPVLVWWDGKYWACIDGHHRILAYRMPGPARDIPVEVFEGSPEEAIALAAQRNTRDKLAMGPSEKQGAAWRLTNTTPLSKVKVAQASGASERLVAYMRKARDQLRAAGVNPAELSWTEARTKANGEAPRDAEVDWDAKTEQEAQDMALKLLKTFGRRAGTRVEAFARALEIYDTRLPDILRQHWGKMEEDIDDDDEEEL